MTIEQRAVMFRTAGEASKSPRLQTVYSETADVLEAMNATYNNLHRIAEQACEEGDLSALRAYFRAHNQKAETMKAGAGQGSGAV